MLNGKIQFCTTDQTALHSPHVPNTDNNVEKW